MRLNTRTLRFGGILIATLAMLLIVVGSTYGRSLADKKESTVSKSVVDPSKITHRSAEKELAQQYALGQTRRIPLGKPAGDRGIGVGMPVDYTYDDFQVPYATNRTVAVSNIDNGAAVDVHFVYEDMPNADSGTVKRSGYNVYNANDGTWPLGSAGCLLQPSPERAGVYVGLDVMPDGLAAMAVVADREGEFADTVATHDFWFQNTRHGCDWTQSWVPKASYQGFLQDPTRKTNYPSIVTQLIGNDTIMHVALREGGYTNIHGTTIGHNVIMYFRKIGSGNNGTWTNGQVIDTIPWPDCRIAAQKGGTKVAVCYTNTSDSGWLNDNQWDNDVFYRESNDGGVTWGPRTNITDYSAGRTTEITGAAGKDIDACYDTQGYLHVVWTAQEVMIKPYRNGQDWDDFNADIWHWSNATNTSSKVADGTYDPLDNIGYWNVRHCGFGPALFEMYVSKPQIAQCGNRMYVIWNQMHSKINLMLPGTAADTAEAISDCAASDSRMGNANWEIFISVSNGMSGELWDAQRNLTNTFTPNCHPDSAGNPCGDEFNPSLSLEAIDVTGLSLSWPDNSVGTWPHIDSYLQISYVEDQLPGSWWVGDEANGDYPTANALKWFRIPCFTSYYPSPHIDVHPEALEWPGYYAVNGTPTQTHEIAACYTGNTSIVANVVPVEVTGSGWLSVSQSSITVPAGCVPHAFNILITPPPAPHAPQWLEGWVYVIPDPLVSADTAKVHLKLLAADVITPVAYDTVATSTAWGGKGGLGLGDNVALVVSNFGEIGNSGEGNTNLDFNTDGNECDSTKNWYLYASSPYYIQKVGTSTYNLTTSHYAASTNFQGKAESWDPATGTVMTKGPGSHDGVSYDSVFAGKSYNRDTTVAMERTFYAPRSHNSNPSFVITRTKLYSVGGVTRSHISFGTVTDWDVPSDSASANTSDVSLTNNGFVYFQGTDTTTTNHCQSNLRRFAAEAIIGWAVGDDALSADIRGMKGVNVRQYFDDTLIGGLNQADAQLWWNTMAVGGFSGLSTLADQGGFVTFIHDYTLAGTDTLTFWTVLATLRNGTLANFESNIADGISWSTKLIPSHNTGCCVRMGDFDGDTLVTMSDLTILIAGLFILYPEFGFPCDEEANMDLSADCLATMGDLTVMIDHLFITLTPLPTCDQLPPQCR